MKKLTSLWSLLAALSSSQAISQEGTAPHVPPINLPIQRSVAISQSLSSSPHTIYETKKDVGELELCFGISATTTDGTASKFSYGRETLFINGGSFPMAIRYIPNNDFSLVALYGKGDTFLRNNVELCLEGSKPVFSK